MSVDTDITQVVGARLVQLKRIDSENGSLVVGELPMQLPFVTRRIFTLFDIPEGEVRGTHAHRQCEQFLICMTGSVSAIVDDGAHKAEVLLDDPALGLYMPALTWGTQYKYSADAVLLVLASDPYDADDYIHEYDEFVALALQR
ncbi:MAG: WxcM-like domain-containing protein [Salinibacterium sp.]|nr:WxcM-like domain-containing protein [Salinibacterium sp.]